MEHVALTLVAALLLAAFLLRRPGVFAPELVFAAPSGTTLPGDEDEQLPETDRAPRARSPLAWTVAAVAALRLVLLVALHA